MIKYYLLNKVSSIFFMSEEEKETELTPLPQLEPKCIDESCKKKHRPDGSHYSSDPKTRMAQLQSENRVGGQYGQKGGRPKVPRASAIVAERIREEGDNIANVYVKNIKSKDPRMAMEASKQALEIERHEAKLQMEEERHDKEMSKDEILSGISKLLSNPRLSLALKKIQESELELIEGSVVHE